MEETNLTASAIISFTQRLEDSSSAFYEQLGRLFERRPETFLAFAKEDRKNRRLVTRTYQETISDALEACFSFEGLRLEKYTIETALTEGMGYSEALVMAIELEDKACKFYLDVAERSESLLATIPRAFMRVAKKRSKRKPALEALRDQASDATP